MTLVFDGDTLTGSYFYIKSLRDIRIDGTVLNDRSLVLNEYDAKGVLTARFTGKFLEKDPKGSYGPETKLRCEVTSGNWEHLSSGKTYPFYLRLTYAVVAPLSNRYRKVSPDDDAVEKVAETFLRALRENDRNKVAALIHYPFNVYIEEKGQRKIRNKNELLRNYDDILTPMYKENLEGAIPRHMFFDKYGFIMLGTHGPPWIGPDLKIWLFGQTSEKGPGSVCFLVESHGIKRTRTILLALLPASAAAESCPGSLRANRVTCNLWW